MDTPSGEPNPNRPELASQSTIDTLLMLVDGRLTDPLAPAPEWLRTAHLTTVSPGGEPVTISIEHMPTECSRDGATTFIHVFTAPFSNDLRYDHWSLYPSDDGSILHKNSLPTITDEAMEKLAREETAEGRLRSLMEYTQRIRDQERAAGYSAAYEHEALDLIALISGARPFEATDYRRRVGAANLFKELLRRLRSGSGE